MKKSEIRLYNILLPLWLLMFMPPALLVTIPVNFAVDSAVLFFGVALRLPQNGQNALEKMYS